RALDEVDFRLYLGEVVGLVGDNGAGKSTLMKVMSGLQPADQGEFWFAGKRVDVRHPRDAFSLGIQTVYQDLGLCDNLDTVQNLFLGREKVHPLGTRLNRPLMEHHAAQVLRELSVTTIRSLRIPAGKLSGGQRQAVAICRSLLWEPKVVLLDEPTAALGVLQRAQVMALIGRLRAKHRAVVMVTQSLSDVKAIADRVVVLRLGKKVAEFSGDVNPDDVLGAVTGVYRGDNKSGINSVAAG
ncbi:MAG: sugar ABC transporter ATP-binding protein, partial [Chloroflexota bacterium]